MSYILSLNFHLESTTRFDILQSRR